MLLMLIGPSEASRTAVGHASDSPIGFLRKPGPIQGLCVINIESISAMASPLAESPTPVFVLASRPCPHSWYPTSAISAVLLHEALDLRKFTEPLQKALQEPPPFTRALTVELNHVLVRGIPVKYFMANW